jgi:hypothetical protein
MAHNRYDRYQVLILIAFKRLFHTVPFESVWVPIRKNVTTRHSADADLSAADIYGTARSSTTPVVLTVVIASLSSLLITLIYFTMRSYRALVNVQTTDDECIDCANQRHPVSTQIESFIDGQHIPSDGIDFTTATTFKTANSYCDEPIGETPFSPTTVKLTTNDNNTNAAVCQYFDQIQSPPTQFQPKDFEPTTVDQTFSKQESNSSFYDAHFHHSDDRFICDDISNSLLSDMISSDPKTGLECSFDTSCQSDRPCCASRSMVVVVGQASNWNEFGQSSTVSMVANPLNDFELWKN